MSIQRPYSPPEGPLIIATYSAEIVTAIGFFAVAFIFEAINSKRTATQSCSKLYKFQLAVTGLIILLSIVHAVMLAHPAPLEANADPMVACALFTIFVWTLLFLPLIDRGKDAAYPHYGAWAIILVFEFLNTTLILFSALDGNHIFYLIDSAIVIVRWICLSVMLAGSAATKYVLFKHETATPEETQPLLEAEPVTEQPKTSKDEDEDADADSEDDEDSEFKEELAELKKRSWTEYITSFKPFLPFLRPQTKEQYGCFAVMLLCTGVVRVLNVLNPLSLGKVVDSLEETRSFPWKALSFYLVLNFINSSAGISVVHYLASVRLSMSMRQSLDTHIYNHIMNLDANFHNGKKTAILGRIIDRGDAVLDLCEDFFFELMPTIADLFISLAVLQWLFGAYVCFIVAMTGILFSWSNAKLIKHRTVLRRKFIDAWCAVYDHMFETQYNWATVSHFNQIEHEKKIFRDKNVTKMSKSMALQVYTEVTKCTRQLIMTVGFILAVILATFHIVRGHRKVGDFVMLVSYWSQVMAPVRSIVSTITRVSERLVDAEKLLLVLGKKSNVQDAPDAVDLDFKGGSVDFEDVHFSYDGERTVSEGITFHADAGQTIALVGETGGGKSTLLKLLFRFYDPKQGRILIDGQDLKNVKLESFRELIGIVPQDPAMFNRTVFDNVRYPDESATEDEVVEACKAACLHDKIMTFAKQYKEKVGERGTKLSGGESQRLAIARAILKKPKMLLLDEATSSVDSVTESKIQDCLRQLCKGRTTFIIAHRLSTILHADTIMVIKGGKLMEMGPHRQLIRRKGAYRELWDAQLNLQAQNPGDISDTNENADVKDNDEDEAKGEKKQALFFNDMGKEEINEAMLQSTLISVDDAQETKEQEMTGRRQEVVGNSSSASSASPNPESRQDVNSPTTEDRCGNNHVDVGSEDVTVVESDDEGESREGRT